MTYEITWAFGFEAKDDDEARRTVHSITLGLGDVIRNHGLENEPIAFVDGQGRNVPLKTPAPARPLLIDPESSREARNTIREKLESSGLRSIK